MNPPIQPQPQLFTGRSSFLEANPHLVAAMVNAAGQCRIESAEDIYDATGIMLWARNRPVTPELLSRISERELAKPIELCVTARDPVTEMSMQDSLDRLCRQSPDLELILAPHRDGLLALLSGLALGPKDLLMLSVLRYGGRDELNHAYVVGALAVAAGRWLGMNESVLQKLLHASLLHDIGLLYLPAPAPGKNAEEVHQRHPHLGALAAVELVGCDAFTAELVANSHERLDGHGFPRHLRGESLTMAMQALGFAEAIAGHLCDPEKGAQRATLATRLVRGEFSSVLVGCLATLARSPALRSAHRLHLPPAAAVAPALRQLHTALSRLTVLLSMPYGEADWIQREAPRWLGRLEPWMQALRYSGVEHALAMGQDIEGMDPQEIGELSALREEIEARLQSLLNELEQGCSQNAVLRKSRLVAEILRIASAVCPPHPPEIPQ